MAEKLTDAEIAELRRLMAEARPTPWHRGAIYGSADFRPIIYGPDGTQVCAVYQHVADYEGSADLIAKATAALPSLLDEVESARSRPADPDAAPDVEAETKRLVDALLTAKYAEDHDASPDNVADLRDARTALLDHVRSIRRRADTAEAAAQVVDAQAEALLERATAAESALAEARRERDRLVAEWVAQADVYDAEAAPPTRNDDERRTALVKFVTAIALRDCARKLRALTPGADDPSPDHGRKTP